MCSTISVCQNLSKTFFIGEYAFSHCNEHVNSIVNISIYTARFLCSGGTSSDYFKLLHEVFASFLLIFCLEKEILLGRVGIPSSS